MAYFKFDRKELDGLSADEKKDALYACDLAEKMATYYQEVAKEYVENGRDITALPPLEEADLLFLSSSAKTEPKDLSKVEAAALKIFLATQMDFYCENPKYMKVFPAFDSDQGKEIFHKKLQSLHKEIAKSYPSVDAYFEKSFSNMEVFAKTLLKKAAPKAAPKNRPPRP